MREARAAGPTLDKSSTVQPASWARASFTRSEVFRQSELAARDDVLLDLRGAAAHGLDDGRAIGALEAAAHRRFVVAHPQLAGRPADVERLVRRPLRQL